MASCILEKTKQQQPFTDVLSGKVTTAFLEMLLLLRPRLLLSAIYQPMGGHRCKPWSSRVTPTGQQTRESRQKDSGLRNWT